MHRENIVILGAGIAGLSAAYHLGELNKSYWIFEKEDTAGGLCRSKRINGFTFDYDGHLLHFKHRWTLDLIKKLMHGNLAEHQRNSWVYSFDTYTRYPFQANLFGLPSAVVKDCFLGFVPSFQKERDKRRRIVLNGSSFEEWIIHTFGEGIARHFMFPYNRKFWTVPLKELSYEWTDRFIPRPSLEELINGTVAESKSSYGYNAFFWYPKNGGIQEVVAAFAKRIKKVETDEAVRIDLIRKEITFKFGRKLKYEKLISTLPLPELAKLIGTLPKGLCKAFSDLQWISIFNLNLGIDRESLSDKHWVYFPAKEFVFYRVGFPHNFSSSLIPAGKASLYAEVSYSHRKPIKKSDLTQRIINDLIKAGIFLKEDKILVKDINDIKYGYVIYDKKRVKAIGKIMAFLSRHQIFSIGRFGSWKYLSMEDAILEGKEIAGQLSKE